MNKVVVTKLHDRKKAAVRRTVLPKMRAHDDDGELRTFYRLDASSETFDVAFTKAFSLSVAKARKKIRQADKRTAGVSKAR